MRCPPHDALGITSTRYVVTKTLPAIWPVQVAFDTTSFAGCAVSIVAYAARFPVPFSLSRCGHFIGSTDFNHLYKKRIGQRWEVEATGTVGKHLGINAERKKNEGLG